jgi:hypothetical protein
MTLVYILSGIVLLGALSYNTLNFYAKLFAEA